MAFRYDFSEEASFTNEELALELSAHTALTAQQLHELLPRRADKQRLAQLIEIVNSSSSKNRKIAALRRNLGDLGGVLLKILQTVV